MTNLTGLRILGLALCFMEAGFCLSVDNATYWKERESVIEEEEGDILGQNQTLTEDEEKANEILMKFKMAELDSAFHDLDFPPRRNFLVEKDEIDNSEVFKILKKMPKGAALHIHDSSSVSTEWVVSNLTYMDDLYMRFTDEDKLRLRFMETPDSNCNWHPVSSVRRYSPTPEEFDQKLTSYMTLVTDNPQEKYRDINEVWAAFDDVFNTINGVVKYRPAYEIYLSRLFQEFMEDNVQYVEIRSGLGPVYELDGNETTHEEIANLFEKINRHFVTDNSRDFFGSRVIFSMHRSWDMAETWEDVEIVKELKRSHPSVIAGFDLVGQEDLGPPLKHLIDPLLTLSSGEPKVPVFYHAGETNWMGMDTDENLIDALLLNASRIGHGYAITKHPVAKKMALEQDVPLEVCPISNQVLMLVSDLRNHPAAELVSEGFPIVISSDDPAPFGAKGLSYDFYEAFMALGGAKADLRFLKQLAVNSIRYSSLDDALKANLMKMWQGKWDEFIKSMISS